MASKPADDALCRRCDDSGLVTRAIGWDICTCRAGGLVLEQREKRRA